MTRARAFEIAVAELWRQGHISGEMHAGTGEEAVAAGVVSHLGEGDGLALTHRCSPALVVRGVPMRAMLAEMLGRPEGLGGGRGGHMHQFSKAHLAATSGIVGASAPLGAGFALAAKRLRPGNIAVAFAGDGAMNQGMLLETLNLAKVWSLPLLMVCVDNGWAITTRRDRVTAGELTRRAEAFGWTTATADGESVEDVDEVAADLVARCRRGRGPAFIHATCPRLDGHYLGDPLVTQSRDLTAEATKETLGRVVNAALQGSRTGAWRRVVGLASMMGTMARARASARAESRHDPLVQARTALRSMDAERQKVDAEARAEVAAAVDAVLASRTASVHAKEVDHA